MSGIVGSRFNTRGSGPVGNVGTDGQVFTSSGAGVSHTFEDAAGGGSWNLIKTLTSDGSDATMSFVDGADSVVFDSTYKNYIWTWSNIHPEDDNATLRIQVSTDGGSNYNTTATSSFYTLYSNEAGTDLDSGHYHLSVAGTALSQDTIFQMVTFSTGNDADQCCAGTLEIFNTSDTTFVKNYQATGSAVSGADYAYNSFVSGYFNTTSALDAIQFKCDSGEIQAGSISMYGIST